MTHGLEGFEGGAAPVFADAEAHALEAAIAALEHVPDDPGFALIGRAQASLPQPAAAPDQSIATSIETPIDAEFHLQSPAYS
jgi:hypothetical protein